MQFCSARMSAPPAGQVADVRLAPPGSWYEHVGLVARRVDLLGREADLEAADAGSEPRGPDLRG